MRAARWSFWVTSLGCGLLLLGCNKDAPKAAPEARSLEATAEARDGALANPNPNSAASAGPNSAAPNAGPAEPAAAAPSRISEPNFELSMATKEGCSVGKQAQAEIVLEAKPPFHVNDKYPYKFKAKESKGVTYAAQVVGKDAAKLEAARVTLPVAFTASEAGAREIAGQFAFSVCTDDKCLIEKRDLALACDAK